MLLNSPAQAGAILRFAPPGIIRQATAALATARAAQIPIISLKLNTNAAMIEDSITVDVAGSTPRGGFSAASLISFARSSLRISSKRSVRMYENWQTGELDFDLLSRIEATKAQLS